MTITDSLDPSNIESQDINSNNSSSHAFSLERLLNIYAQVISYSCKDAKYNDSSFPKISTSSISSSILPSNTSVENQNFTLPLLYSNVDLSQYDTSDNNNCLLAQASPPIPSTFNHFYDIHTGRIEYCNFTLSSSINFLIEQNLIRRNFNFKVNHPIYISNIPKHLVESVSISINYPLNNFLYWNQSYNVGI